MSVLGRSKSYLNSLYSCVIMPPASMMACLAFSTTSSRVVAGKDTMIDFSEPWSAMTSDNRQRVTMMNVSRADFMVAYRCDCCALDVE